MLSKKIKNPTKSPINNKTFSPILATDFSGRKKYENVNKNMRSKTKEEENDLKTFK
jgi:hypothetical protein